MPKRLVNALNPKTVASLTKPGSYADGGGLELRVDAKGARSPSHREPPPHLEQLQARRPVAQHPDRLHSPHYRPEAG